MKVMNKFTDRAAMIQLNGRSMYVRLQVEQPKYCIIEHVGGGIYYTYAAIHFCHTLPSMYCIYLMMD